MDPTQHDAAPPGRLPHPVPPQVPQDAAQQTLPFTIPVSQVGSERICTSAKEPFPAHTGKGEFATATRPDILIYSDKIQTLIYIELTSPWEAKMSQAHRGKMMK